MYIHTYTYSSLVRVSAQRSAPHSAGEGGGGSRSPGIHPEHSARQHRHIFLCSRRTATLHSPPHAWATEEKKGKKRSEKEQKPQQAQPQHPENGPIGHHHRYHWTWGRGGGSILERDRPSRIGCYIRSSLRTHMWIRNLGCIYVLRPADHWWDWASGKTSHPNPTHSHGEFPAFHPSAPISPGQATPLAAAMARAAAFGPPVDRPIGSPG